MGNHELRMYKCRAFEYDKDKIILEGQTKFLSPSDAMQRNEDKVWKTLYRHLFETKDTLRQSSSAGINDNTRSGQMRFSTLLDAETPSLPLEESRVDSSISARPLATNQCF